ncbi:helicase HerA domain-containing protein [Apilactobacillus timberlakei]|uniref:helicase HerA domain-containing protein n=1 Tax=Apilactobacillus timberlakei TaxID=2008380 RepID=UPI001128702C|nr:DUF87 domain-containing protein [Apilactobacillus timberlakei]TPR16710.1 hypothetical protein DYZ95_06950 [Apilactobacillus timberlakei]TPR21572.1 hypothetical protein DY083_06000 [Apilactobacillus timberlakei]
MGLMPNQYDKKQMVRAGYDLDLIARTQPAGNIKIHPSYIQIGDTYVSFVDVYSFPKSDLPIFWLSGLLNNTSVNMISFLSVGTENAANVRSAFNQSNRELTSRLDDDKLSAADRFDANMEQSDLYDMYRNISHGKESMKKISLRLMVYANSIDDLYQSIQTLKEVHYGFKMTSFVGEQQYDYKSTLLPKTKQEKLPNKRRGHTVASEDLGAGYPFDYTSLTDPGGNYFGYTNTMGAFLFNPYLISGNRVRSFSLIAGSSGVGKSTLAKMFNDDAFMRGNKICNFDVNGEFVKNTKEQNGLVMDIDSSGNNVNMFEVFPTVVDHDGNTVNTIASFNQNISKIKTIAHIMDKSLSNEDLGVLENTLTNFYIDRAMWFNNPREHIDELNILGLPHNQYPRLAEFVNYLEDSLKMEQDTYTTKSLNKLNLVFSNMENNFAYVFDNYTSDNMDNLLDQNVIDFDMSKVKAQADPRLFQANFFSYLSLISSQVVINGQKMRNKISKGEITDDKMGMNVTYYYINIDEAQNYFDASYPDVANMLSNLMEEMRKNYCSITLIFPTLEDILPSVQDVQTENARDYQQAINKIFGLFQYQHFFQLPSRDVDKLKNIFDKSNSVSSEQIESVNNLNKYEVISVITGGSSYQWTTELNPEQASRYQNNAY